MNFKQFFFSAISSFPSSSLIRERFPFQQWLASQHLHFAFYTLSTFLSELWAASLLLAPTVHSLLVSFPCWNSEKWPLRRVQKGRGHIDHWLVHVWRSASRPLTGWWKGLPYGLFLSFSNWPLWIFNEIKMEFNQKLYLLHLQGRKKKKEW